MKVFSKYLIVFYMNMWYYAFMASIVIDTPIGKLTLASNNGALVRLDFGDLGANGAPEDILLEAEKQLKEYFAGERKEFSLELAPEGTPWQSKVWTELTKIPYGKTISYGELACRAGSPMAARAAGMANNRNPISIIIPCHRVIGADGKLVGYGGGLPAKEFLLKLETENRLGKNFDSCDTDCKGEELRTATRRRGEA